MSTAPIFDDPIIREIFGEMEYRGWQRDDVTFMSLSELISDTVTFKRSPSGEETTVRFSGDTDQTLGVTLALGDFTYAELRHAAPRRVRAFLDIMGIVPARDEWVQWFREMQWGEQERDQD